MNFLNPVLLPLLLLASLPIVIHLLNRLRYRTVKWAAMMFLLKANKSSTRHARLRQYLILACRCLLLFFFLFALARPIVGGWLGMQMASAPDTVVILLDRSASMEAQDPRVQKTKRAHAIDLFADAAAKSGSASRYVLIESVLKNPQEISGPESLRDLSLAAATDTAADIPAMLRAANEYFINNPEGRSEIWIASDMQSSNWRPDNQDWHRLSAQLAALPQDIRVRLLALNDTYQNNLGVTLLRANRLTTGLDLAVALKKTSRRTDPVPVAFTLNGARVQSEIDVDAEEFRLNRLLDITGELSDGGWGSVELPADENGRDNTAWFVYGQNQLLQNTVVAADAPSGRIMQLATFPDGKQRETSLLSPDSFSSIDWSAQSLVVWQGALADGGAATALQRFAESGGVVLFLPPTGAAGSAEGTFDLAWTPNEKAGEGDPFRVVSWEENDGPLARSQNGRNLPVDELEIFQRSVPEVSSEWYEVARYVDGSPFLLRRSVGDGWIYALSTLPTREWSLLTQGTVLVPMVQRMIGQGSVRQAQLSASNVGEWRPGSDDDSAWESVDAPGEKDPRWDAGVYMSGQRRMALNRPVAENDLEVVDAEAVTALFGDVKLQIMQEDASSARDALSSEIWKTFVFLALLFMVAESLLISVGGRKSGRIDHGFKKEAAA